MTLSAIVIPKPACCIGDASTVVRQRIEAYGSITTSGGTIYQRVGAECRVPVLLFKRAKVPVAVFSIPLVLPKSARAPIPVFLSALLVMRVRGLAYTLKTENSPANTLGAQKYLKEAVRLDPKFALAWALLSYVDALGYLTLTLQPTEALRNETGQAAETALALHPNLGEAILAKGY